MPVLVSIAALRRGTVTLSGQLPAVELDLGAQDPCLQVNQPLRYELNAELMEEEVFVQGELELTLDCVCVRCLSPFQRPWLIAAWSALVPLAGEDAPPLVDEAVDLTPQIREDSLLGLPQHPVCRPDCRGLASQGPDSTTPHGSSDEMRRVPSAWSVLDTLKLD